MSKTTKYGPGDEQTWGACTGHPLDPRTEDTDTDDEQPEDDFEPDLEAHAKFVAECRALAAAKEAA